jgi:putative membrane protein
MNSTARMEQENTEASAELLAMIGHWAFFGLFLLAVALACLTLLLPLRLPGKKGWPEAVLVISATATTLTGLSRQLPLQNVLLAAGVIGFIGSVAYAFGAVSGIPFGPFLHTDSFGPRLFGRLPWAIPLIWTVAILASRGVARLILRPWRKLRTYGFWLIGLTCLLSVMLELGFDPFATRVKHYWIWEQTHFPFDWYGAPLVNFFSWGLVALLILAFATPALINKRPRKSPADYHPLIVWLLLGILFATGAAAHQLWAAVGLFVAGASCVLIFAIRGGSW